MPGPFDDLIPSQPAQPATPGIIRGQPKPEKPREAPSGYRFTPDGGLAPIPGGPADKPQDNPNAPQLPRGFMWKDGIVGGEAVLIKGIPAPKGMESASPAYSQSAIDAFDRAISTAERLKTHPGFGAAVGSGFDPQAFGSYNPLNGKVLGGTNAAGFESELEAMKAQVFLPMVQSMKGMGALSNAEGDKLTAAIGSLNPNMPEEQFQASLDRIMDDLKSYRDRGAPQKPDVTSLQQSIGVQGVKENPSTDTPYGVDKSTNIITPTSPTAPSGPNYKAGPVESYVTSEDRQRTQRLQDAYNKGASPEALNSLAQELGLQPFPEADMRVLLEARQAGEPISLRPQATGQQGLIEKGISYVADSPVGAYGIGVANALTLGGLDEVAGLIGGEGAAERAQFAKQYSRENSPVASMVGEAAGFAGLAAIPGVAPAMTSVRGGAALGGIYGGLDTNENRLMGAGISALTGGAVNKYAPQAVNALTQFAQPAITRGQGVMNALAQRLPGAETRAVARQEVAQNADVIAAGLAENIPVRQPDVRPSLRDSYGGAEASQYGGPKIQAAASEDAQAIANRLAEIGGGGTQSKGYNLGSVTQDAVKAEKDAMRDQGKALFRRVDLQAPGFNAPPTNVATTVDGKIADIMARTPEGNEGQIANLNLLKNNFSKTGVSVESIQANRAIIREKMKKDNLSFTQAETDLLDVINTASQDLENGLRASGNDAALQTLQRANKEWRAYTEFKRDVVKTMVGTQNSPVSPEQAAQRLLAMVKPGGSSDRFATIYKSLPTNEKAGFKALIAENLGKNSNGEFSLAFLAKNLTDQKTNLKTLREVFGPDEFQSLMNLRTLAKAKTDAMKGKNFSNTARAANNQPAGFSGFVRGALGFSMGDAAGAAMAVAGPNIAERIGTKRTVDMLLDTDFSKWLANMPNTNNPRAIDAYLKKLDRIKSPAVSSNVVVFKDYLRQVATQSPGRLAASEQERDAGPVPPQ